MQKLKNIRPSAAGYFHKVGQFDCHRKDEEELIKNSFHHNGEGHFTEDIDTT